LDYCLFNWICKIVFTKGKSKTFCLRRSHCETLYFLWNIRLQSAWNESELYENEMSLFYNGLFSFIVPSLHLLNYNGLWILHRKNEIILATIFSTTMKFKYLQLVLQNNKYESSTEYTRIVMVKICNIYELLIYSEIDSESKVNDWCMRDNTVFNFVQKLFQKFYNFWKSYTWQNII